MVEIRLYHHIDQIKRDEWDDMIPENVFVSHGWLKTIEETFQGNIQPIYLVAQRSKDLVGAAVCYIMNEDSDPFLDYIIFGRARRMISRLGISFLPALICWPLFSFGSHLMVKEASDPEKKGDIVSQLLNVIERRQSAYKSSLIFLNVMDQESDLVRLFEERGYLRSLLPPINFLDIQWSSFSGYLDHLKGISRHSKKDIRYQMNKNRKAGVTIGQLEHIEGYEARLYRLISDNHYKYSGLPLMLKHNFLRKLKENLGKYAVIYVAFKDGRIIGTCYLLKRGKTGFVHMAGVDHEASGNDFTYFNLCYYRPIMDAISGNIKRLFFGREMYELKMRRGCKTSNTYIYYKPYGRLTYPFVKLWFAALEAWIRHRLPERAKKNLKTIRI
jgi:predicted N-acyltransferase